VDGSSSPLPLSVRAPAAADARRDAAGPQPGASVMSGGAPASPPRADDASSSSVGTVHRPRGTSPTRRPGRIRTQWAPHGSRSAPRRPAARRACSPARRPARRLPPLHATPSPATANRKCRRSPLAMRAGTLVPPIRPPGRFSGTLVSPCIPPMQGQPVMVSISPKIVATKTISRHILRRRSQLPERSPTVVSTMAKVRNKAVLASCGVEQLVIYRSIRCLRCAQQKRVASKNGSANGARRSDMVFAPAGLRLQIMGVRRRSPKVGQLRSTAEAPNWGTADKGSATPPRGRWTVP
jgi:hypothetical protein